MMPVSVSAQSSGSLPVAVTVPVGGVGVQGGQVVIYETTSNSYAIAERTDMVSVYGVTVQSPPLLFATATDTTPVITSGAVYVQVNSTGGSITRGDVLVTSAEPGVAMKAIPDHENVFAIALEDAGVNDDGTVLVQFDPVSAKALLKERRELEEKAAAAEAERIAGLAGGSGSEEKGIIQQIFEEYTRATIATIIAVGSLFFVMYTFRSTIINATLAVGRNPRARNAIMTVSVENIIFALIICALAIFVAIAVLVLPV